MYSHVNTGNYTIACVFVCVETGSEYSEKVDASPGTETSNKTEECKAEDKKTENGKKEIPAKEQNKEVSEVVKAMRKRREDMAAKDEKKLKEEKERLATIL